MPIFALYGPGETQFPVHLESVGLNRAVRESSLRLSRNFPRGFVKSDIRQDLVHDLIASSGHPAMFRARIGG